MRTIAVVAQKGGQSKTTSVVNMAAALAGQGRRVLVVDSDTQASATFVLNGGEPIRRPGLAEVLNGDAGADDAIVGTTFGRVSLIAADPSLAEVNVTLAGEVGRERRLRAAMADMRASFDYCLIDTGPNRSLLTSNVLNAAGEVIVPISPGVFGVLGLEQLRADMGMVRRFLENKSLTLAGVFLVMMERTKVSRDFERGLRDQLGPLVFDATIPRAVAFEEANARRRSIFEQAPSSPGAAAYQALTLEVIRRGRPEGQARRDARRDLPTDDAAA